MTTRHEKRTATGGHLWPGRPPWNKSSALALVLLEDDMALAQLVRHRREMSGDVNRPVALVTCPNCLVLMVRISLKSSESEKSLHEATHRCPRCATETRRWIKL